MADPLFELLVPYLESAPNRAAPSSKDPTTTAYLNRLTTLPLAALTTSEPEALKQSAHSLLVSTQGLSSRSHASIIASSDHLSSLRTTLPTLAHSTASLRDTIPTLDSAALQFSETYNKHSASKNAVLERRRKALLLSRNVDRLQDILELPTLLSSAISSSGANTVSTPGATTTSATSNATLNYASALDLNAHVRRLQVLYPESRLVNEVTIQAEEAMQAMCSNLIASLKTQGVKLASAMRTISWLRRVAPELDSPSANSTLPGTNNSTAATTLQASTNREGSLGLLFLLCRLSNLMTMLSALSPLRDLADAETLRLAAARKSSQTLENAREAWSGGQQTERYLKRYIEIFREQSFAVISMFKSIFPPPAAATSTTMTSTGEKNTEADTLLPLPSALATFPQHLVSMLLETLKTYLPNVRDKSSRDSLLTQVLYCAGSLGRLGGDFSMILAFLHEEDGDEDGDEDEADDADAEWVEVIRKHRVLAGRLEVMVGNRDA